LKRAVGVAERCTSSEGRIEWAGAGDALFAVAVDVRESIEMEGLTTDRDFARLSREKDDVRSELVKEVRVVVLSARRVH